MRRAISAGVRPVAAIQMATLNAAECLGVDRDHGSLGPGKIADVVLVDDLEAMSVRTVVADGRVVAVDGELVEPLPPTMFSDFAYGTVKLPEPLVSDDFTIDAGLEEGTVEIRVIEASGETVTTLESIQEMQVTGGTSRRRRPGSVEDRSRRTCHRKPDDRSWNRAGLQVARRRPGHDLQRTAGEHHRGWYQRR